ncbi:Oidioi.mRNA.OKI2018_I69.chr2.g4675.t1.cds [Oikopleura dioica]|uniref:Oidioi.mRNA.OKI2018_I69.chr2.g4675.t1.cds n=1 Tax=Oikopleura dioica TaxID=34765 RepID=A0ABN7SYI0_OIKDI|nr:Oidioi.mRNA.OKI2018_I69.chr2.g4675.t1.cds [Oikopleura dioica]
MGNCCSSKKQNKTVEEPKIQEDTDAQPSPEKHDATPPSFSSCTPKSCSKKTDAVIEPTSKIADEEKSKYDNLNSDSLEPVVDAKLDLPENAEKTSIRSEKINAPKELDSEAVNSFADALSSDCQRVVLDEVNFQQEDSQETMITPDFVEETLIQPVEVENDDFEGGSRIEGKTLEEFVNENAALPIIDNFEKDESSPDVSRLSSQKEDDLEIEENEDDVKKLESLAKAPDASPKVVWDEAETRGGKRRGTDLFERRRQLCDQHTMESQRDGPKDDLFATKQKVANLAGGMRTPAQSNEFLSSIAKDDEMAREKLSKRYAEMEKRGQLGQRNPGVKKAPQVSQENLYNFSQNKTISDFDQPPPRPRRWSRGSTQSLECEKVDTDLLRSDEKVFQVRQLMDKETGKRLEYNKLAAVPKNQIPNPESSIEPIAEQDACVSDRIAEFSNRQPDVVIDMEKAKLDFSSYSSGNSTLSKAEEEKLSPETLKKRKARYSENESTGVDLRRKMNDGFQEFLDFVDDCQSEASAVLEGNFVKPDPDKEDMFKRTLSQRGRESPCPRHWGEVTADLEELPKMTRPDRKIGGTSYKELAALPPKKF